MLGAVRMFVAVVPPDDAREHLDEFLEVRRGAAGFRWVPRDQLHVTLAFLAGVPERRVDELEERLERAAQRRTAFDTALTGGGAFPNVGRARALWAGLDLDETNRVELGRLATGARAAAAKSGIAVDGARFKPHLTVARLRHSQEATAWVRLLDAYRGPSWTLGSVELVASYLGEGPRNRPRYETWGTFPLGSAR
jgi:2'-5' RNA ligase